MTQNEFNELEEFDKLKTKVLKYVLYKKRTKKEVLQKFSDYSGNMLDSVIEYLCDQDYINDENYIEKCVNELKKLKNLSLKELKYKLLSKGLPNGLIDDYIDSHKQEMIDYEINSAKNIILKKTNVMEYDDILQTLRKKGYTEDTIKIAGDNNE